MFSLHADTTSYSPHLHPRHYAIQDIFGYAPMDVIADISAAKVVKKALTRAPRQRSVPNLPVGRLAMEESGASCSAQQNVNQDGSDKRPTTNSVHRVVCRPLLEASDGVVRTTRSSTFDAESGCSPASVCGRRDNPQLPIGKTLPNGPIAGGSSPGQQPPCRGSADLRLETDTLLARLHRDDNSAAGTKAPMGVTADPPSKLSGGVRATQTQDPAPRRKHSGKRKATFKSTAVVVSSEGGESQ